MTWSSWLLVSSITCCLVLIWTFNWSISSLQKKSYLTVGNVKLNLLTDAGSCKSLKSLEVLHFVSKRQTNNAVTSLASIALIVVSQYKEYSQALGCRTLLSIFYETNIEISPNSCDLMKWTYCSASISAWVFMVVFCILVWNDVMSLTFCWRLLIFQLRSSKIFFHFDRSSWERH